MYSKDRLPFGDTKQCSALRPLSHQVHDRVGDYFRNGSSSLFRSSSASPKPSRKSSQDEASLGTGLNRDDNHLSISTQSEKSLKHPPPFSLAKPTFKWIKGNLIGKGSYGRVYLALNATAGEIIAVKQVELPQTASDRLKPVQQQGVDALKDEIETLKDLEHPNIVRYLGFEENLISINIFLEYVSGGNISTCLRDYGIFREEVTKDFTRQILEGLAYLHSKGILHRDLKADNILIDTSGVCKISDFGISKKASGRVFSHLKGTVYWMAPEIIDSNKMGYDVKIDIWSVGCVVFEMWTARRPWHDEVDVIPVMMKLSQDKLAPPLPGDVRLSETAEHFRRECFHPDPKDRPSATFLLQHPYLDLPREWHFPGMAAMGYPTAPTKRSSPGRQPKKRPRKQVSRPGSGYEDVMQVMSAAFDMATLIPGQRPPSPAKSMNSAALNPITSNPLALNPLALNSLAPNPRSRSPPLVTITPPGSPKRSKAVNPSHDWVHRSRSPSLTSESSASSHRSPSKSSRSRLMIHNPDEGKCSQRPGASRQLPFVYNPPPLPEVGLASGSSRLAPMPKARAPYPVPKDLRSATTRYPASIASPSMSPVSQLTSPSTSSTGSTLSSMLGFVSPQALLYPAGNVDRDTDSDDSDSDLRSASSTWKRPPADIMLSPRYLSKNATLDGPQAMVSISKDLGSKPSSEDQPGMPNSAHEKPKLVSARPVVEEVFEHLEEFFPDHDVDDPVVESPIEQKFDSRRYTMKSIRAIAEERMSRGQVDPAQLRRQTRLWDSRVEEIVVKGQRS
ncbi:kinase-like domain-containing protein [Crassisporium funariophilum]|nr:kinase-like domain-containing protein [Crassisporium funariophilum]